jgi:ribosome-binding ATPase YchF (GTP1/OBG family)
MALSVGIVGLPNSGKTTLFKALTRTGAPVPGRENVGMATIPDERLEQVAAVENAKKITPAALRVVDVPGTGAELLGNLRQVDALLVVLDAWSGTRSPDDDLVSLQLELLIADRDHVERRLERVRKQAKSGDPQLRDEVAQLEAVLAHLEAERPLTEWPGEVPPGLEPLTTKPQIVVLNGPDGLDAKLEAELAELPEEEAAAFREGSAGALGEIARRLYEAVDLISFFTAADNETRAWPLRRGQTALEAAGTIHTDIARGFIRCEVIRWTDFVEAGSRSEVVRRGQQRLEGKNYVVEDGDVLNIRFNL